MHRWGCCRLTRAHMLAMQLLPDCELRLGDRKRTDIIAHEWERNLKSWQPWVHRYWR